MITPDQQELRDERQAIMSVEQLSQEVINKVFEKYSDLYGTEEKC